MTTFSKNLPNARVASKRATGIRVAAIGLGSRSTWMIKCMCDAEPSLSLAAVADPIGQKIVREKAEKNELRCESNLPVFESLEQLLDKGADIDAIVLGTRCHLHTPQAIRLARTGLPLFLEKPVAISWEQLNELREAFAQQPDDQVVVSFPLPMTPIFESVDAMVRSGRLGTINQIQAVNNVSYGAVYIDEWYQDVSLTGGLWLQKATHDFDYIHRLSHAIPTHVSAMHSRQVWGEPTLNQDAGSALVQYDNGQHACYTQNFLTRRSAGKRGAILTGEDATVHFDWYAAQIRVTDHRSERVETIDIEDKGGHGGGDPRLAKNFIEVIKGNEPSNTPMRDGLLSVATCLAARDAAHRRTVEPIPVQTPGREPKPVHRLIEPLDS